MQRPVRVLLGVAGLVALVGASPSLTATASADNPLTDTTTAASRVTVPSNAVMDVETASIVVTPRPLTEAEQMARMTPVELADYRTARGDTAQAATYPNGLIPEELLCELSFSDSLLRCDAAAAIERAVEAGMPTVELNSSYRSLSKQRSLQRIMDDVAIEAGRSQHGWGIAIDVPADGGMQDWLREHPESGWVQPSWALPGGNLPEPWHFEFHG